MLQLRSHRILLTIKDNRIKYTYCFSIKSLTLHYNSSILLLNFQSKRNENNNNIESNGRKCSSKREQQPNQTKQQQKKWYLFYFVKRCWSPNRFVMLQYALNSSAGKWKCTRNESILAHNRVSPCV